MCFCVLWQLPFTSHKRRSKHAASYIIIVWFRPSSAAAPHNCAKEIASASAIHVNNCELSCYILLVVFDVLDVIKSAVIFLWAQPSWSQFILQMVSSCVLLGPAWHGFTSKLIRHVGFCVVASLLAGPGCTYKKKEKKKVVAIFALFKVVCGCEDMRLESVATRHISVSSVIYVHEGLYNRVSVWKLEMEAWLLHLSELWINSKM